MEAWRTLVHAHATVLELPTFDCLGDDPDKLKPSLEIAYYASERALPINGVYGARPVRDCTEDERRFPNAPEDGTLYVWFAKSDRHARRFVARGASCGAFEYGWACSTNHEAIAVAMRAGALEPMTPSKVSLPLLAYGQRIQFGTASSKRFLTEGWSYEEATGRWSEGPVATLQFRMTGDLAPSSVMKLNAASMMCGRRQSQDVDVAVNDTTLATLHFDRGTNDIETVRSISVPGRLLQGPEVIVDFKPHDVRPPNTVRCNDDPRRTGVWLRELWFEAQP